MSQRKTRYTVIGAGNGGKAMAAHLAIMGFEVTLYNHTSEKIAAIQARGGITLESQDPAGPRGFGRLARVTSNMQVAIENCDIAMVVTPAYAHYNIAQEAAPYLQAGQIVVLNPGRTLDRLGIKHLSVSELTRYVTGLTKHQLPIQTRHPKLTPLSVTRVEQARKDNRRGTQGGTH